MVKTRIFCEHKNIIEDVVNDWLNNNHNITILNTQIQAVGVHLYFYILYQE